EAARGGLVVESAVRAVVRLVPPVRRLPQVRRLVRVARLVGLLRLVPGPRQVPVQDAGGHGIGQQRRGRRATDPVFTTTGVVGGGDDAARCDLRLVDRGY